ncbi:MAG: hypothetical protein R3B72_47110 [Polyangiaceae bacterium]
MTTLPRHLAILTSLFLATACTSQVAGTGGGGGGEGGQGVGGGTGASGGSTPENCNEPDTSCPTAMPFSGGLCEGNLTCPYEDDIPWTWTCTDGFWTGEPGCNQFEGGCPPPIPAETCSNPSTATLSGISVQVGPIELGQPFRPYAAGELVNIEWGLQGAPMVFFHVRLEGDQVPNCVDVTATLSSDGLEPTVLGSPVTLHCGESLRLYSIVPFGNCGPTEPVPSSLTIDVAGIGSTTAAISIPAEAFCPPIGG